MEASDLYMLMYDKKFLEAVRVLGLVVLLYLRYVDDITVILLPIKPGWQFSKTHNCIRYEATH